MKNKGLASLQNTGKTKRLSEHFLADLKGFFKPDTDKAEFFSG